MMSPLLDNLYKGRFGPLTYDLLSDHEGNIEVSEESDEEDVGDNHTDRSGYNLVVYEIPPFTV